MTKVRKPIPKTQKELSNEQVIPTYPQYGDPNDFIQTPQNNRALNTSFKGDTTKPFSVGIQDIDEAIYYYFQNIVQPSVTQNGARLNVPIIYGSPEKWKSFQKDGFYRDQKGKIMAPLIMFKKTDISKNRQIANKLDANYPNNFGVFTKEYTQRNAYDNFKVLSNRKPQKQYYAVVMPDYLTVTYECVVFTYYVEQLNKIVESMEYASDSYWGDPQRYQFKASIDSFGFQTELAQDDERIVKSTFTLKINGYIIPEILQKDVTALKKFSNITKTTFTLEDEPTALITEAPLPPVPVICAPGTVINSDSTYNNSVNSGGTLILPDSPVNINGVNSGNVVSVKDIDVNLVDGLSPVTPVGITITGNTIDIDIDITQPVDIEINGNPYDTIDAPATVDIPVINTVSGLVGTITGLDVIVNDSVLNVNKSDGSLISSRLIAAETTGSYNVADSNVRNSDTSYSTNVKATENLVLPDQTINVNNTGSGLIPSVGNIGINLTDNVNPIIPTSVNIVGRDINIVVTSSAVSYNLTLIDKNGNTFPQTGINSNASWDLRTLTPYDYANIFLSQLNSPSATIVQAITEFVSDMVGYGLWDNLYTCHPFVNANANDHALNLKYPFRNPSANYGYFVGSPTHNSNGITTNGSNAMVIPVSPDVYANGGNRFGISIYSRTDGSAVNTLSNDFGGTTSPNQEQMSRIWIRSNNNQIGSMGGSGDIYFNNAYTGSAQGLFSTCLGTTVDHLTRNGVILTGGAVSTKSPVQQPRIYGLAVGAYFNGSNTGIFWGVARNYAYASTQQAWTVADEVNHYVAVQKMQTTLGRQV